MTASETTVLNANRATFRYVDVEDRLLATLSGASGEQAVLLFTRRLVTLLVNSLAGILEKSSPVATRAPEEMRDDIVLMEHQGALAHNASAPDAADAPPPAGPAPASAGTSIPARLIRTVNITTNPTNFVLRFQPQPGEGAELVMNRVELHRLVELLKRFSEQAGWNLQIDAAWLETGSAQLTLN